jgi:RHS repeat-associated protein
LQDRCTEEYSLEGSLKTPLVQTSYNSEGEPISYQDALGQKTHITIDYAHLNTLGQKVLKKTIVNPIGVQTEIEFDALSRVCSLIKKDASGAFLSSQKISYDLLGSKTCEIHDQIADGQVVRSHKIAYVFGPMGRLEEEIEAPGSPLEKHTLYQYNALGKMISKLRAGQTIHYTYNKAGFLRAIKAGDQISHRYSYDRNGNIISAHSLRGKSVHRTYNAFNQVTSKTVKDSIGTYASHYHYDRKGRLKKITLPDESKIEYIYDAAFGREVRRISAQEEILYSHTYEQYDTQGKLLSEHHISNAGLTAYTYDENGQKTSSKNDFFSIQGARDSLGRLISTTEKGKYTYNDLSQLTSEDKKSYAYDSLDNRIKVNNTELTYNDLNQLETCGQAAFSYDAFGNLLRKVLDGEETRYTSDPLSQFISIEKGQTALHFSYDPLGRLLVEKELKKKKTVSTSRYLYLGHQEIGTLSESGDIETLKIPGLQGHSIAFEINGAVYAPLHDFSGNVVGLIDPLNRTLVESYHYTAFGEESGETSLIGNPWRFAGKRVDERSGLIFFGLRFYDPEIGRWISPDPAGYIDGPNAYAYLHNNPLNNIDRFGLATEALSPSFIDYVFGEVEEHCYCETHRFCKRGGDIGKTTSSHLPKITYCETFEQMYPGYERSKIIDLSSEGRPSLPEDLEIGFINGIWKTHEQAQEIVEYISRFADGCNVHAVYNATHGKVPDFRECCLGLLFIATDPVHLLHKMWNSFFDKSSANAKFLMICHSQGAIHVRNALLDYSPELRKRILVVAIAPAAYIYQETCAKVIHYRAHWWRDLIPLFDWIGAQREKDSIVTLDSHPNAPFFDHGIMSPTYQENLRRHIQNYIKTNGEKL